MGHAMGCVPIVVAIEVPDAPLSLPRLLLWASDCVASTEGCNAYLLALWLGSGASTAGAAHSITRLSRCWHLVDCVVGAIAVLSRAYA